jgi:hypothetical protein
MKGNVIKIQEKSQIDRITNAIRIIFRNAVFVDFRISGYVLYSFTE